MIMSASRGDEFSIQSKNRSSIRWLLIKNVSQSQ